LTKIKENAAPLRSALRERAGRLRAATLAATHRRRRRVKAETASVRIGFGSA
jgi:hypothetical protein